MPRRHVSQRRLAALALAVFAAGALTAGFAQGRTAGVRFMSAPQRVVQGSPITIELSVSPAGALCSLRVRYAGGSVQEGLGTRRATRGRATWRWRVPRSARAGRAMITATCDGAGRASRMLTVIGEVLPLKINVVKTGWSMRPLARSTRVSYGVLLENTSTTENAQDVDVLVNFVMPDNRLIGSAKGMLPEIRAATQHAWGGELIFPGTPPIDRLEVVVEVRGRTPRTERIPAVSAVRVLPDPNAPDWVGSVEGEIANDDAQTLRFMYLSTVVLDSQGNILGGGRGTASARLPTAARQFFKIRAGVGAIPLGRAATAIISVVPQYIDT